jgi:hypothetical protein
MYVHYYIYYVIISFSPWAYEEDRMGGLEPRKDQLPGKAVEPGKSRA